MSKTVNSFSTAFAKQNPPLDPGLVPLKLDNLAVSEGNRWPCEGGPMEGLGIAKSIQLKKGAGKKKQYITFSPSNTVQIRNEEGTIKGFYEFTGESYKWIDELPVAEKVADIWDNEYWEKDRKEKLAKEND